MSVVSDSVFWKNVEEARVKLLTAEELLRMDCIRLQWQVDMLSEWILKNTGKTLDQVRQETLAASLHEYSKEKV